MAADQPDRPRKPVPRAGVPAPAKPAPKPGAPAQAAAIRPPAGATPRPAVATAVRAPTGATPVRAPTGATPVRAPTGATRPALRPQAALVAKPAPAKAAPAPAAAKPAPPAFAKPASAGEGKAAAKPAPAVVPDDARGREALRLFALGAALHRQGRLDDACRAYGRALLFKPDFPDAYTNLGVALRAQGKSEAAVACHRRALGLKSDGANYHSNLGNALRDLGRLAEAAEALQQALRLAPNAPEILYNFGLVLRDMGRFDTALSCLEAVLKLQPEHAECRYDRALTLLFAGDLKRGFAEYETRWKLRRNPPRKFDKPRWNGQAMPGKTLLLYAEAGFAEAIQFARYAAMAKKNSGAAIVLECPPELARLLETLDAVDRIAIRGAPLPAFDAHIPLLSLPALMATTAATVPADVPYLRAPEIRAIAIPNLVPNAMKVGIAWAGNAEARAERHRSCPFVHFLELAQVPGVALYSLQTGDAGRALGDQAAEPLVYNAGPAIADFADLATAINQLDLVISVDTAIAHLAGALAKPVWTLLSTLGDWRYAANGAKSPWYPSMRLFRQKALGEWPEVMAEVGAALHRAASARKTGR